ncbi:phosphate ABC transporter permease subunit PstC [Alphaproteobacteria bacterium KMM 3653]|uniref:Phosphate transport system permease protein n=1 Tax=Harenicola maris TaxID=2841044 RepID=A0AAP2CQU6_9RHOB|nr:phosphate ABC transporter permease subunit PstC [Harenicola maris]
MPVFWIVCAVLAIGVIGYGLCRSKAMKSAGGNARNLHSLPSYYGANAFLFSVVAPLALLFAWLIFVPILIDRSIGATIPEDRIAEGSSLGLMMADVSRVSNGLNLAVSEGAMTEEESRSIRTEFTDVRERLASVGVALGSNVDATILQAAQKHRAASDRSRLFMSIAVIALSLAGLALAMSRTKADFRARNTVEAAVKVMLIAAASVAILTTLGIVLSLLFNTIEFFRIWPATDFFFNTTWSPSFGDTGSELGLAPLLWGTFYISIVALAVAVPVGLFAAIYLAEYASPKVRAFAKPLLEILAGIPTIVYGLFALLTVGPLLVSFFGDGGTFGVEWMRGGTAVMTAGLVMGVMLIPFVSSLSDDIINAVPQAMRDGSLGIGATKSETIRQVVLPAALPGIVGAILLAASRAIGETMIVVMGAGAAAKLSLNPFEAMTTVTAKIVSQLTGDSDFASPQALVAFALGMSLFVITLALNVLALYIVRRYREQYD